MSEKTLVSHDEASHQRLAFAKSSPDTPSKFPIGAARNTPPENIPKSNIVGSFWKLPGLDKTTFYGAALYLHAAAKGQLREIRDAEWDERRQESIADAMSKDFLDRLADCFARSKSKDAQDHISATAMELDIDLSKGRREIRIYVAKNLSGKNMDALPPNESASMKNEDEEFASRLCTWFNEMSSTETTRSCQSPANDILDVMYTYNKSRLAFYVRKIHDWSSIGVPKLTIWRVLEPVVQACKRVENSVATRQELSDCARVASDCRSNVWFQEFGEDLDSGIEDDETRTQYRNLEKWINYLGRLNDAYDTFRAFCIEPKRRDFTYKIIMLKSPAEEEWPIETYKKAVESWTGDLGLNDERAERLTVKAKLDELASKCRGTARVHCEIQLLRFFVDHRPARTHLDYMGCSKKSCWLCWQVLGHNGRGLSTKATHRMIYPMWAVPVDFSDEPRHAHFASSIVKTYKDMITLIEDKVLFKKEFSSRMNISHTSPRLIRNRDPSIHTVMSGSTIAPSQASLFSSESTTDQGRDPVATVPVVHFPATSPIPQLVHVDVFDRLASDYEEGCANMRRVLLEPWAGESPPKEVVFAFQLNTKVFESDSYENNDVNMLDWQKATWCIEHQPWISDGKVSYAAMFRLDEDNEEPNPWFLQVLEQHHGDSFRKDLVPWYGDVFVIAVRRIASYQPDLVVVSNEDALRLDECVLAITADLTSNWELSRYSSIRGYHLEQLQKSLQGFINRGNAVD
ncbi:Nn.00g095900.m01.CDS01 [Neocucurbitaria sp. VM-36]